MPHYTQNGTYTLPHGGDFFASVDPGLEFVVVNLASTGGGAFFGVTSAAGSNITINDTSTGPIVINADTNGGQLTIGTGLASGLITLNTTIDGGGTAVVPGNLLNDFGVGSVLFGSGGGTEMLGTAGLEYNLSSARAFSGFTVSQTDVIDDQSLVFSQLHDYVVSFVNGAGTQTVTLNAGSASSLTFNVFGAQLTAGTYSPTGAGPLTLTRDASGGTDITPVCYLGGTRIATPQGETAVEALEIGDLVLTTDGVAKPIMWIGRQTVSTRWADPLRVMPIRVRAGALSDNLPSRDLLLSPSHALLVDDVLVQAGALVNGVSIVREARMPMPFVYYHVEILNHSLILAEGVPAETFVDNVERLSFDNWEEHKALYSDGVTIPEMDLPRAKSQRQVPQAIRERLLARGHQLFGATAAAA